MNYALIFAGGVGSRMNTKAKPKQFLEISGKPIIIRTIEYYEENQNIDSICLVCVAEWIEYTYKLLEKYNIKKVRWILPGGKTALESQHKGLEKISSECGCEKEDVVLIHDGVRPLISNELIDNCIESVLKYGSAITVSPAIETIVCTDNNDMIESTISRDKCKLARAPQAFFLKDIINVHNKAISDGKHSYIDSASLMMAYGYKLHIVDGPSENIKVTNPSDFYITRALLDARENSQIFGI